MGDPSPSRPAAVAVVGVLLFAIMTGGALTGSGAVGVGGASAAPLDTDPVDGVDDAQVAPITECFAGEGYPLVIGDPPATIDSLVHLSVLTDPSNGGEFGVELSGTLENDRIVTLAAGVRLSRAGLVATGVNPFAAFDILYTYELRLPMFDGAIGQSAYEEERPPVSGATEPVPC
ncbi:hypothetical protein JCM18237_23170 [Halorubrum luteum]